MKAMYGAPPFRRGWNNLPLVRNHWQAGTAVGALNKNNGHEDECFGKTHEEEKSKFSESKYGTRNLSPCPIVMGQGIVVN